jgi:hypothetical protein
MKKTFYFPHDGNARNDDKIIAVRMRHKMEGYGVYFAILERLLESSNYVCVKDYNLIAFDLHVGADLIKSIVEDFGLFQFTDDGKLFYSESFNERMIPLDNLKRQRSEAGKKSAENRAELNKRSTTVQRPLSEKATEENKENNNKEKPSIEGKKKSEAEQRKKLDAAIAATLKRKELFYKSLTSYVKRYGKDMIRAFYDYWTEPNKSKTKMRFELNKTWDLDKRLATWNRNEPIYGNKNKQQEKPAGPVIYD